MKIKKTEEMVKEALEFYPSTREDDFILIGSVYEMINKDFIRYPLSTIIEHHVELGLPSIETITRARRKLQRKYPDLMGSKQIKKLRKDREIEFYQYALEK